MMMEIRGWRHRKIPVSVRENETGAGSIIVVPGLGYTPAHPLLHFSAQLFHAAGFTVLELWWHDTLAGWRDVPHEGASQWLGSDVLAAVEAAGHYGPVAGFVTKSLGTIGLSAAATKRPELRERPAVWLTPILTNHQVVDALTDWKAPSLAVIAAGDQVPVGVDPERIGKLVDAVVMDRTDHALECDDPLESVRVLETILTRVDAFARRVGPHPAT